MRSHDLIQVLDKPVNDSGLSIYKQTSFSIAGDTRTYSMRALFQASGCHGPLEGYFSMMALS